MIKTVRVLCLILALVTAVAYFLLEANVMHAGVHQPGETEGPPGFGWIMGVLYIVAGLVIFLQKRRLTIAVAIANVIPIIGFYAMWAGRSDIMSSAPGLITKIPQILMEAGLIYLLIKTRPEKSAVTAK
jgi:hypothetical protein